ncbi:hypothetical protein TNCV_2975711 [Trichonephila clavipes]|nr:hypothetical protein TNCV_2975711 [Trichonephila clavipes]
MAIGNGVRSFETHSNDKDCREGEEEEKVTAHIGLTGRAGAQTDGYIPPKVATLTLSHDNSWPFRNSIAAGPSFCSFLLSPLPSCIISNDYRVIS